MERFSLDGLKLSRFEKLRSFIRKNIKQITALEDMSIFLNIQLKNLIQENGSSGVECSRLRLKSSLMISLFMAHGLLI